MHRSIIEHDLKMAFDDGYQAGLEAAQPKWISVEDRLPEESGSYLVCTRRSDAFTAHFYLNTNEWKSHFAGSAGKHITHWLPLPPAPNDNKEEQS